MHTYTLKEYKDPSKSAIKQGSIVYECKDAMGQASSIYVNKTYLLVQGLWDGRGDPPKSLQVPDFTK